MLDFRPLQGGALGEPLWAAAWVPWAWQQLWACSPVPVCLQPACSQPAAWPRQVVERVLSPSDAPGLQWVSEERRAELVLSKFLPGQAPAC